MTLNALLGIPLQGMDWEASDLGTSLVVLLGAVGWVPLVEEILFRGYGLGFLMARGFSPWAAAGLVLVGFAAIHALYFGLGGALLMLLWGVLPTVLRLWSGDVIAAWLLHTFNNFFAYWLLPLLLPAGS
jgi:membrane protease YdiL (CAAX protease family)